MSNDGRFSFEISLSVLNHLGRNLYRSFLTVLGEAISNSWDADANNVWLYIDKDNNSLVIKDDGSGMNANDFQNKFLKIGYSKRKDGDTSTEKGRPYIGRKGIGKLALLSCADTISVLSKIDGGEYVGGVIDNSELDQAITDDLTPKQYQLGDIEFEVFGSHTNGHDRGTIIYFENIKDGIKNSVDYLKRMIALYFRFSLIDQDFCIWLNDENITHKHLSDFATRTQFLWCINDIDDPYLKTFDNLKFTELIMNRLSIKGFIASVEMPRYLKVTSTEEKIGVDLFVNGRLREKDILKHIPTARIVESYLYGQIHYDELDELAKDRFTSSREGIVADDDKFKEFLDNVREILTKILNDWDKWRDTLNQDGDPDNPRISKKQRRAKELFNAVSDDYSLPKDSANKKKVDGWVNSLAEDATFNFSSYAECFISENLIRKYIDDESISLTPEAETERDKWRKAEIDNKNKANISIEIRQNDNDLSYLSMDGLANLVDKKDPTKEACLSRDAKEYKPIRDALAHTALLTELAKNRLTTVYENIKGRVKNLFEE
jgi:hypothetical protein